MRTDSAVDGVFKMQFDNRHNSISRPSDEGGHIITSSSEYHAIDNVPYDSSIKY